MAALEPALLQQLVDAATVAALAVDLDRGEVIHTNRLTRALTGVDRGPAVPLPVAEWAAAAGLLRLDARPVDDLAALVGVAGEPAGEPLVAEASQRVLWPVRLPVDAGGTAVVTLLPLPGSPREHLLRRLRDRALSAADMAFTLSDPALADNPLIWCNAAFSRMTGYPADEVVGRNARFLQGENTEQEPVTRIRQAMATGYPVHEVVLNYRKDGTPFWNQLSISPVHDESGAVVNYIGSHTDVTERVLVQSERRAALADAEQARSELRLLTEATTWMNESLDMVSVAARLTEMVVPALADYCCVDLLDEPLTGRSQRVAAKHRTPHEVGALYRLGTLLGPRLDGTDPLSVVLSGGRPDLRPDMPEVPPTTVDNAEVVRLYQRLRPQSMMVVPLRARGRVLGVITLCTERPHGRRYSQRDLHLATDLADRAAMAMDNARLYFKEHSAVETLQRSLLPAVPTVAGLTVAARYLVSADESEVGGDWYDLLPLPDGAVGLAVGDVVGHDLNAAAAMGQLRGVLRSYAWEGLAPGPVLDRCDQLVQGLDIPAMATAIYARLEPKADDGSRLLRYANAGHPPPLLRGPDGQAQLLDQHVSPLIGAVETAGRDTAVQHCRPGTVLLLYTDGLTDVRGQDTKARTELLRDAVAGGDGEDLERFCDQVLDALASPELADDIAVLAVRLDQ